MIISMRDKNNPDRLKQITHELIGLCGELTTIAARAIPLLKELDDLGVELDPATQAMFLAILNNAPKKN